MLAGKLPLRNVNGNKGEDKKRFSKALTLQYNWEVQIIMNKQTYLKTNLFFL